MTRHRTSVPGIYYRVDAQGHRRYIVWYSDATGKGRTETLPLGSTLEDAKRRKLELATRKVVLANNKLTVGELLDAWIARRCPSLALGTQVVYRWGALKVKAEIGDMKVAKVTADIVASLRRDWVGKGYKKNTIAKMETPLRMALKTAVRDGLIQSNPYDLLLSHERVRRDQKEMRCLSSDEIRRLLKPGVTSNEQHRTLFATLLTCGLRFSEASALLWSDIDLPGSALHVRQGKTPAARRQIPLPKATGSLLRARKLKSDPGDPFVFRTAHSSARDALTRACERAGIPRYTLHELRHTYASLLVSQGEPVTLIAKVMGHTSPKTTLEIYAHLFDARDSLDQARDRLDVAIGGML